MWLRVLQTNTWKGFMPWDHITAELKQTMVVKKLYFIGSGFNENIKMNSKIIEALICEGELFVRIKLLKKLV